jgi:hypothetical protein
MCKSQLVLQLAVFEEHLNEVHCYHHQWPLPSHQYRNVQHFHLHDLDHLKTPESTYLVSARKVYKQKPNVYVAWIWLWFLETAMSWKSIHTRALLPCYQPVL